MCRLLNSGPLPKGSLYADSYQQCGDSLFDDIREYRSGGVERLKERMQRSGARHITATPYDPNTPTQHYIYKPRQWLRSILMGLRTVFPRLRDTSPQPDTVPVTRATSAFVNMPPLKISYLLSCMHQTQRRRYLVQERVEMITNDRELFCFIQNQLRKLHSRLWTALHMRKVAGIHFTRVSTSLNRFNFASNPQLAPAAVGQLG